MALRINTNVSALNAHKNLLRTDDKLANSLAKLSSGLRINKAADDASGMVIADSLRSQALGLGQAIRNGNDAVNIVQTADAALEESVNIVNIIKTKSIQAAQDGQTTDSRNAIQSDIIKLTEELNMIANTTSFNNQKLLSGNFSNKSFQVGSYANETIDISIASSQAGKLGHTMIGRLVLEGDKPGAVDISLYSNVQSRNFDVETVNVAFDNSYENSMGAVAGGINKLSDVLGISAKAFVNSSTEGNILDGRTDKTFAINDILIGQVNVLANDTDGALTAAINNKTNQHGVTASVDATGIMTLTSSDGRAIKVTAETETSKIFGGTEMSTVGYVQLNQSGSSEIIINDTAGGNVITTADNALKIRSSSISTLESTVVKGSTLSNNTVLGASWTTNQIIYGDKFTTDVTTTKESMLTKGSTIGADSIIVANGTLGSAMQVDGTSTALLENGTALVDSAITSGTILGAGSVIAANTTLAGDSIIEETTVGTFSTSTIETDSLLSVGTVLGSSTTLAGLASITVDQTGVTAASSTVAANSVLGAGTILAAGTAVNGSMVLQQTGTTMGDSTIASGSILAKGSVLGAGTEMVSDGNASGVLIQLSDATTGSSTMASGAILATGTTIAQGTVLTSGLISATNQELQDFASGLGLDSGATLTEDYTLTAALVTSGGFGTVTLAAGSIFGNGTDLYSGSIVAVDVTLSDALDLTGGDLTARSNSSFAVDTVLDGGISTVQTDIKFKTAMTADAVITALTGSSFGKNTTFMVTSDIETDVTLISSAILTGALTAEAGTTFGADTKLATGSVVSTDITLSTDSTLTTVMATLTSDMVLGKGTILGDDTVLVEGSSVKTTFTLDEGVALKDDMSFGAGTVFENAGATRFNAGSLIGGRVQLDTSLTLTDDMIIGVGSNIQKNSILTNGSTLGGDTVIIDSETVKAGTQMELAGGSTLKNSSIITKGTYLTNDITTTDGVIKAGQELQNDIIVKGDTFLKNDITLEAGSVVNAGSTLAANAANSNAGATQLTDVASSRLSTLNVLTQENAQSAIAISSASLISLDKVRAALGSVQNQLTATISNISTTQVNVLAAESSIRDVDFAAESSTFTKLQILSQAGTFALSQANTSSQNIMSLLQ